MLEYYGAFYRMCLSLTPIVAFTTPTAAIQTWHQA